MCGNAATSLPWMYHNSVVYHRCVVSYGHVLDHKLGVYAPTKQAAPIRIKVHAYMHKVGSSFMWSGDREGGVMFYRSSVPREASQ